MSRIIKCIGGETKDDFIVYNIYSSLQDFPEKKEIIVENVVNEFSQGIAEIYLKAAENEPNIREDENEKIYVFLDNNDHIKINKIRQKESYKVNGSLACPMTY